MILNKQMSEISINKDKSVVQVKVSRSINVVHVDSPVISRSLMTKDKFVSNE